ncbi:MAG: hypothetical protein Q9180_001872 [Flavoplaca navasiana]
MTQRSSKLPVGASVQGPLQDPLGLVRHVEAYAEAVKNRTVIILPKRPMGRPTNAFRQMEKQIMDQKGFASTTIRPKKKRKANNNDLDDRPSKKPARQATKPPVLHGRSNGDLNDTSIKRPRRQATKPPVLHDRPISKPAKQATKPPVLSDSSSDASEYHPPTDSDDHSDDLSMSDASDSTIATPSDTSDSTEEATSMFADLEISRRVRLLPKGRRLAKAVQTNATSDEALKPTIGAISAINPLVNEGLVRPAASGVDHMSGLAEMDGPSPFSQVTKRKKTTTKAAKTPAASKVLLKPSIWDNLEWFRYRDEE